MSGSRYVMYSTIYKLDSNQRGYKSSSVTLAKDFIEQKYQDLDPQKVQDLLLNQFHNREHTELKNCALAGLCLRCCVSYHIVRACQTISYRFLNQASFTYQDLLSYVLDDDGKTLIVLCENNKEQQQLNQDNQLKTREYRLVTVEILKTYNINHNNRKNLDNWVYLQIQDNKDIKKLLLENGSVKSSDWAILNKASLTILGKRESHFIDVFHKVYRQDSRGRRQEKKAKRQLCPDPSEEQLLKMQVFLKEKGVTIDNKEKLLKELKTIAQQLRSYEVWRSRGAPFAENLDIVNSETQELIPREDLADCNQKNSLAELEENEVKQILQRQFSQILEKCITQGIKQHIDSIKKRSRYRKFAQKIILGLDLFYIHGISQSAIAKPLGMNNQSQVSRVLN